MKGLDTNVLVRYLTQDDPRQADAATRVIEEASDHKEGLFLSGIVLCETIWVLETAYGHSRREIVASIERMRNAHLTPRSQGLIPAIDVKSGLGGLRDIEFLVQGLQLLHASQVLRRPEGHTIMALEVLNEFGFLAAPVVDQLKDDYTFLRRIEHYLQILEDRQTHTLPQDQQELDALAKRMLGVEQDSNAFLAALDACLTRVRDTYNRYLLEKDEEGKERKAQGTRQQKPVTSYE